MPTIPWGSANRAKLFVRSDLPTPVNRCKQTIVSRLEDLVASDALAEYTVTSWAKRVPIDDGSRVGGPELERYHRFRGWARATGVTLEPGFDTRECYSSTTGAKQTQLVLPAACLVAYEDDIVAVAPHATESETVSIEDALDRIAEESATDRRSRALTAD